MRGGVTPDIFSFKFGPSQVRTLVPRLGSDKDIYVVIIIKQLVNTSAHNRLQRFDFEYSIIFCF